MAILISSCRLRWQCPQLFTHCKAGYPGYKALSDQSIECSRVIYVDKNPAYPPTIEQLQKEERIPEGKKTRQVKYLNNIVKQDHRGIKSLVNPGMGFGLFNSARRTLKGYEAMNMIHKGQIKNVGQDFVDKGDLSLHQQSLWIGCLVIDKTQRSFIFETTICDTTKIPAYPPTVELMNSSHFLAYNQSK